MDHGAYAAELFCKGYNCAQAVTVAFCDVTGLSEDFSARLASSFGGGMGRMREVCGAVSGMFMAAGLLYGSGTLSHEEKSKHYTRLQALAAAFRDKNSSIICRELLSGVAVSSDALPEQRSDGYYKKRPCAKLCYDAASILAQYIEENPIP